MSTPTQASHQPNDVRRQSVNAFFAAALVFNVTVSVAPSASAQTTTATSTASGDFLRKLTAWLRGMSSTPAPSPATDVFGVRKIYPTKVGGREWTLPSDAEKPSMEWNVERYPVSRVGSGVFHTQGYNGEVRLSVGSPSGAAWWRNVETTAYFRYTAAQISNDQLRHWALLVRGERHSESTVNGTDINNGVAAPAGTATWPGYPFGGGSVSERCLGSSYHANFYVEGYGLLEKEITHIGGYAAQREQTSVSGYTKPQGQWFGMKFVVRNANADRNVHLELWLDIAATGKWQRMAQYDDAAGKWMSEGGLDGCDAAPFRYVLDQVLTWAGPWVVFRSDSMAMDFRWLSVREIDPL